jgi:hypothetical protein
MGILAVDEAPQIRFGQEMHMTVGRYFQRFSGLGISSHMGVLPSQFEATETSYNHSTIPFQPTTYDAHNPSHHVKDLLFWSSCLL